MESVDASIASSSSLSTFSSNVGSSSYFFPQAPHFPFEPPPSFNRLQEPEHSSPLPQNPLTVLNYQQCFPWKELSDISRFITPTSLFICIFTPLLFFCSFSAKCFPYPFPVPFSPLPLPPPLHIPPHSTIISTIMFVFLDIIKLNYTILY